MRVCVRVTRQARSAFATTLVEKKKNWSAAWEGVSTSAPHFSLSRPRPAHTTLAPSQPAPLPFLTHPQGSHLRWGRRRARHEVPRHTGAGAVRVTGVGAVNHGRGVGLFLFLLLRACALTRPRPALLPPPGVHTPATRTWRGGRPSVPKMAVIPPSSARPPLRNCAPPKKQLTPPPRLCWHPPASPSLPLSFSRPHSINSFLDHVDVGDCVVTGELEAYSCAWTGRRGGGVRSFIFFFLSTPPSAARPHPPSHPPTIPLLRQARRPGQEAVPLPGRRGRPGLLPPGTVHVAGGAAGGAVEVRERWRERERCVCVRPPRKTDPVAVGWMRGGERELAEGMSTPAPAARWASAAVLQARTGAQGGTPKTHATHPPLLSLFPSPISPPSLSPLCPPPPPLVSHLAPFPSRTQPQNPDLPHPDAQPDLPGLRLLLPAGLPLP